MGNYRFEQKKKKKEMPAGWRGIGCLLMLILPVFSYLAAKILVKVDIIRTLFYRLSPNLFGAPSIHPLLYKLKGLSAILGTIRSWKDIGAELVLAVILLIIFSGIISVIYGFMYRAVAPSRYGPTDAPPPKKYRSKKKSR
ncbi:MAG: hypothetical protein HN855_16730 [Anaerolineae bacterium]|jgi:hypothetical protein|nr:hypothetical protein [Anaerolineae bacterium]MBT7071552.1 hypothetical protein [Anaerolineae bacterium]MBT7326795.1 hypothetical protein [Anaerolineae bacterium]